MLYLNRNSSTQPTHTESNPALLDRIPLVNTTDLVLDTTGDLQLSPSGDIQLSNTADSVIANLFRRLTTPLGGYERWFFNAAGEYVEWDAGWSNPLINEVAAPLTSNLMTWAASKLREVAATDSRLQILAVTQSISGQQAQLKIVYALQDAVARSTIIPLP